MRSIPKLLGCLLVIGIPAAGTAQQQAPPAPMDALKRGFDEVSGYVLKAAGMVPAEKFGYKPTPDVRSVAEMVGHIADGNNYYCPRATGARPEWKETVATSGADKAGMIAKLQESISACQAQFRDGANMNPLMNNFGHVNLHYGNLVTYLRLLGLTPPSS